MLATEAFDKGAKVVALPEFFTGALAPNPEAYAVALSADNRALNMMKRLADKYQGHLGGSMLLSDDGELYNRYFFVSPNNKVHPHDKDLPTMWENAFYTGGNDDGVFNTDIGDAGIAVCWELIRNQTLQRMQGRIDVAITGTHWWDIPENWPLINKLLSPLSRLNHRLSEQAPVEFAKKLGVPVIQASHCGPLEGDFYLLPGLDLKFNYRTRFVGATQIVDAHGNVLASRNTQEGPGIIYGDIRVGSKKYKAQHEIQSNEFWSANLSYLHRIYWAHQNWVCKSLYLREGRRRGLHSASINDQVDEPVSG